MSLGTEIDRDVVVAVLPSGKLLLSVTRDIYEQLGLQGKRSSFDSVRTAGVPIFIVCVCVRACVRACARVCARACVFRDGERECVYKCSKKWAFLSFSLSFFLLVWCCFDVLF